MGKHLKFYKKCLESGMLPAEGLCGCHKYIDTDLLEELFEPTPEEKFLLMQQGKCTCYWASDADDIDITDNCFKNFSPLRQTIVLFMAAINDEL